MKKKILMALLLVLYLVPYVFLGMYFQWIDYGLFMTVLTLLTFIPPFINAYICGKKGFKAVFIYGNILTFIASLIIVLSLNAVGLTDETGRHWYGIFKPLSSTQMMIVSSVISLTVQCIIYNKTKKQ